MACGLFILGYALSSFIQDYRIKRGCRESKWPESASSVSLGISFGFLAVSCSFSELATEQNFISKGVVSLLQLLFLLSFLPT